MSTTAHARIPVGVVVERRRAESPWLDFVWTPVKVLAGEPAAEAWTLLGSDDGTTTYYAGAAEIELYRTETANYRDNLASGAAAVWVILRTTDGDPPFTVHAVTADPAEGEGATQAGNDVVETVPMPEPVRRTVEAFIAEHHVERPFYKRRRDDIGAEILARRPSRQEMDE